MKKIISVFILILSSFFAVAGNDPKLDLVVYYNESSDSVYLSKLFNNNEVCCRFDVIYIKSNESKMILLHGTKKTILGTIYGLPNKKFLTDLYSSIYKVPVTNFEIIADKK